MTTSAAPAVARAGGPAPAFLKAVWRGFVRSAVPVLVVVGVIVGVWYAAAVELNTADQIAFQERIFGEVGAEQAAEIRANALDLDKPFLPAPHQIFGRIWSETAETAVTSRTSLLRHAGYTLTATLLGFAAGTLIGVALSVLIVHNRAADLSLMPWVIVSQTIPILAIAPMIYVVMIQLGAPGLAAKTIIASYLSFFPVVVGMVKGLRSPDALQIDLLKTYSATASQTFWKLRWPSAAPFLFASMKVAIALSLIGAIVGELSTNATQGLGVRLLHSEYNSDRIQTWTVLFVASILAALLVWCVGVAERVVRRRMGAPGGLAR